MTIDGFTVYKEFVSLKLHFISPTYNYILYNGSSKVTNDTFEKRKDKYQFTKIGKKFNNVTDVKNLFVSNFISGNVNKWVGYFASEEALKQYYKWKSRGRIYFIYNRTRV